MKPTAGTALVFNQGDRSNRPGSFANEIDRERTIYRLSVVTRRPLLLLVFGLMLSFVSVPAGLTAVSLFGNVSGKGGLNGPDASGFSSDTPAVNIAVSLPNTSASPGATNVMVPVTVGDTTGQNVIGYDFTFTFNTGVIQLANPAFETNGTLSTGWSITPNTSTPGQIRIVAFNSQPLAGSGTLIFIKFNVVGSQGAMTPLTWTNFMFNEGNPGATLTNGSLTVTAPIPVSLPNTTSCQGSTNVMVPVIVGNTTGQNIIGYDFTFTFNTSVVQLANPAFETNGTLSQGWSVTPNTSTPGQIRIVAFNSMPLSGSGPLIFIKFNVVGSQGAMTPLTWTNFLFNEGNPGATLTNGSLTVTASGTTVQVSLPDTGAPAAANNVMVPITVGDTTGRGIIGYDFTFIFDASVIQLANPAFETNGTLSQGWSITPNPSTGQIRIVAFNSQPLSGAGTLIFMKFNVVGSVGAMTQLTWTNFLFNEGNPCAALTNGKFTVTAPTAVKLERFVASSYDKGVLLEWQTGFEVDNLGFNVYRDEAGKRTLISPQLVAGSALRVGSTLRAGASYAWWDNGIADCGLQTADCKNAAYWLEDVDLNGTSTWHGPLYTEQRAGAAPAHSQAALLSRLAISNASASTLPVERVAPIPRAPLSATSADVKKVEVSLASQAAAKIAVKHEGWYRVTQPELAAAGFTTRVDPRLLQLFVDGRELPIIVQGEKADSFDESGSIEFYGMGLDSPYTDSRIYWLIAGSQPGLRVKQSKTESPPSTSSSFTYSAERRDRSIYFSALRNGERENFFGAVVAHTPVDQTLTLSHIAGPDSRDALLEVALQGVTLIPHSVNVEFNGAQTGVLDFAGQSQGVASFTLPHSLVREGTNTVRLTPLAGQSDVSLVDYVRISYQHSYTAEKNVLKLTALGHQQITVDGFTTSSIRVFDVTDPNSPQEILGSIDRRTDGYAITLATTETGDRSLLVSTAEQQSAGLSLNRPSNLRKGAGQFVIITRSEFARALNPLVALRRSQGFGVNLADVEDIYDEFSFGQKTPYAIRDFLAYAKSNWKKKPGFVLFVGDASVDPKNYLGFGDSDLVPTKLIDTDFMETASDDWLADFDDDGVADLAIGRLPVRSSEEASLLVSKIAAYEGSSASQEVLLAADANDGFDFEAADDQLVSLVPPSLRVTRVNRGRVGTETAKKNLLDGIRRGQKLVNYSGHGSVNQWRANLLTDADALALSNDHLPMFVMMTCLNGYFHDPALDSLAESLMKTEDGGAVAAWASSGITLPGAQATMNHELYRLVFSDPALALGEAARRAKLATSDNDVRRTWVLFGDPTMKLK
jgi:hypothetical protein